MPSKSPWDETVPPGYLGIDGDPPNTMFFGADPAWTPERERYVLADPDLGLYRVRRAPGSNVGKVVIPDSCPICDGLSAERSGEDPMGFSDLEVRVCGRCKRASGREKDRAIGGIFDPDDHRPGQMAAKIVGSPDRKLNAYVRPKVTAEQAAKAAQPNGAAGFVPRAPKGERAKVRSKPGESRQKMDGGMKDVLKATGTNA